MELPDSGATAKRDRLDISVLFGKREAAASISMCMALLNHARTGIAKTATGAISLVASLRDFRRKQRPSLYHPGDHCHSKDHIQHVHVPWGTNFDDRWLEGTRIPLLGFALHASVVRPGVRAAAHCHVQRVLSASRRAPAAGFVNCATDTEDLGLANRDDNAVTRATVRAIVSNSDVATNCTTTLCNLRRLRVVTQSATKFASREAANHSDRQSKGRHGGNVE